MSKLKLPIIIAIVVAAAAAGLFASGMIGGKSGPTKKHVLEPIALAEPFTINLADTDSARLLAFNIALKLEPMDEVHWAAFTGAGGGGHGGATGPGPGELKVSTYPRFYDAVLTVSSTFTYDQLKTEDGKAALKEKLLTRFHEIAEQDASTYGKSAGADDPAHVGPPYHVEDLDFTKFVVQ